MRGLQHAISRYVRGQVLLGLVVAVWVVPPHVVGGSPPPVVKPATKRVSGVKKARAKSVSTPPAESGREGGSDA